jgi:hypothetical protein
LVNRGEKQVNACYDAIVEVIKDDEEFYNIHHRWMTTEELFEACKKKIKGLREIEFYAALELENDEYSTEVKKYLKRIKYI